MRRVPQHAAGMISLTVGKTDAKILQDFIAARFSLSRRTAKAVVDGRNVWVNRKCAWIASFALRTGDVVDIPKQVVNGAIGQGGAKGPRQAAAKRHVRVLWSNESYLVCDKPAGMVSAADPKSVETLLREQEGIATLQAVHRLDRDTTGCLMFAKNHAAFLAAVEVFKTHKVSKTYHAIVAGEFPYAHQVIDTPLDNKPAVSKVVREDTGTDASLLRIRIETGRTNQIRRHLAQVRFPVAGDRVFGLKRARDPRIMQVPRQMLHASTLMMSDPFKAHKEIKVHSPLPTDFRAALKLFGMGK